MLAHAAPPSTADRPVHQASPSVSSYAPTPPNTSEAQRCCEDALHRNAVRALLTIIIARGFFRVVIVDDTTHYRSAIESGSATLGAALVVVALHVRECLRRSVEQGHAN